MLSPSLSSGQGSVISQSSASASTADPAPAPPSAVAEKGEIPYLTPRSPLNPNLGLDFSEYRRKPQKRRGNPSVFDHRSSAWLSQTLQRCIGVERQVRSGMWLVGGLRLRRECGKLHRVSLVLETLGLYLFCFDLGPCRPVCNLGPFTQAKIGYYT
ncbi:uncharacterized protein LOC105797937 [Gossypium raimondii]|uniref:uncharacterized protein LOC105797937 n=1 Tax=Gossypium raimondii TaxID=29730 RepID=UPI00063AE764|nr:uncharacterized protein LOC105797937 [Gossypium raimondii]